jgi:dihydrolipoamide dehydrogenase
MSEVENRKQLVVIGAGSGGYPAAFLASDLGMNVALIDTEPNPGGVCLFRGCIPSKTLLHVAKVVREAREAQKWGISFNDPSIDLSGLRDWKNQVVQRLTGGLGQLSKQRGIQYIQGKAKFIDVQTIEIVQNNGESIKMSFEKAIIATGSRPSTLPNITLDSPKIMNAAHAMELHNIPESLLIVGGGYIGLELGTIYATFGTKVSVVEMLPGLLPGADQDLVRIFSQSARKLFHEFILETRVKQVEEVNQGLKVSFEGKNAASSGQIYNKILISIGRRPNSGDLGLENTKVDLDSNGFIQVDGSRRTKEPSIYAIGDVVGGAMLAHKATHEGKIAVEAISGKDVTFEPKSIPAVLFTDPEVAWCGLTEIEAREQNLDFEVAKFPWGGSGKAVSLGRIDGLTKVIVEKGSEKVLGMGIVGPSAGDLISEGALALEMEASVKDLARTIHPHPTLSESIMESAEVFSGTCTHIYRPKK